MSKCARPTLFAAATALSNGFHSFPFLFKEPHYLRVRLHKTANRITIELRPSSSEIRMNDFPKSSRGKTPWNVVRWWEDPEFADSIRKFITSHPTDFGEPQLFTLDGDDRLVGKEH